MQERTFELLYTGVGQLQHVLDDLPREPEVEPTEDDVEHDAEEEDRDARGE